MALKVASAGNYNMYLKTGYFGYPNRSDFLLSTDSTRNIVRNKEQKRKLSGSTEPSVSGADNHDNIDGLEQSEGTKPDKIR